jgi:hypothetical protein
MLTISRFLDMGARLAGSFVGLLIGSSYVAKEVCTAVASLKTDAGRMAVIFGKGGLQSEHFKLSRSDLESLGNIHKVS